MKNIAVVHLGNSDNNKVLSFSFVHYFGSPTKCINFYYTTKAIAQAKLSLCKNYAFNSTRLSFIGSSTAPNTN